MKSFLWVDIDLKLAQDQIWCLFAGGNCQYISALYEVAVNHVMFGSTDLNASC